MQETEDRGAVGTRAMEVVTALVLMGIGAVALWDARRLGFGWSDDGPRSGTFPFWIALFLVSASALTLLRALRRGDAGAFVTRAQLRRVLSVLVPTVVYVGVIFAVGLYVASALLVAYFMAVLGGFRLRAAVPAGVATAVVVFVVFELWFLVGLPKGPVEEWLGF